MARGKKKYLILPSFYIYLVIALGIMWVIGQVLNTAQNNSASFADLLVGSIIVIAIVFLIMFTIPRQSGIKKAHAIVDQQMPSLIRRWAQLVQPDSYGKLQFDRWNKETDYFFINHINPALTPRERRSLESVRSYIRRLITNRVQEEANKTPILVNFSDGMTPSEFETFCSKELQKAGWDARVTMRSRDQGVDVIAEKNGIRLVLQCKLYAKPVGNKAVQEITAGKVYEQAQYAAVVTNNRYTSSAEQLASANGVFLLHYSDLQNINSKLNLV